MRAPLETIALETASRFLPSLDEQHLQTLARLVTANQKENAKVNFNGDPADQRRLWVDLIEMWLGSGEFAARIYDGVLDRLIGPDQDTFILYEDTRITLERLRAKGYKLAVISNWDSTLQPVLSQLGVLDLFDLVVASLIFGAEKPAPEIFLHVLEQMNLAPHECLHVGDSHEDDFVGAQNVGMPARLIARPQQSLDDVIGDLL